MAIISDDKSLINRDKVVSYLIDESYWAKSRTIDQINTSIDNSLCFVVMEEAEMIGFARVITDYGVFAYLADVYIDKEHRGKGLGKQLMKDILAHPDLQIISRWMLGTMDAHELYRPLGFSEVTMPNRWMEFLPGGSEID